MKNYWKILFSIGLQLLAGSVFAQQISINALRFSSLANQNRMMFDVTASPKHKVFVIENPSRLVIDIKNAHLVRPIQSTDRQRIHCFPEYAREQKMTPI